MKSARAYRIVLVTAPDLKTARRLAQGALEKRLIACANLIPKIESHYVWQGRIENSAEVLLILKTTRERLAELEAWISQAHPYDTPEFLALSPEAGSGKYLRWLSESCAVDLRRKPSQKSVAHHRAKRRLTP